MTEQPFEWDMCSEWRKGEKPLLPKNPKAKFLNIYVSRLGPVLCFAEESEEISVFNYELMVRANTGNPNLEWAATFPRSVCKL